MQASSLNRALACALLVGLGLAGCGPEYEIDRPGTWRSSGANDRNLRAMIADPRDLDYGIASTTDRGSGASRAITRVLTDRRRALINATVSRVSPAQDSADSGGGAGLSGSGTGGGGAGASAAPSQ